MLQVIHKEIRSIHNLSEYGYCVFDEAVMKGLEGQLEGFGESKQGLSAMNIMR